MVRPGRAATSRLQAGARSARGVPRANCWTIAEHAGDATPDEMQHLLARGVRDHDAVRDDLREYVVEHLGDPDAVLGWQLRSHVGPRARSGLRTGASTLAVLEGQG
jgi:hypothetical protein